MQALSTLTHFFLKVNYKTSVVKSTRRSPRPQLKQLNSTRSILVHSNGRLARILEVSNV